jgi:hypothetical protein
MNCFEYTTILVTGDTIISVLNEKGKDGWEVVTMLTSFYEQGNAGYSFLLKREIDGE